MSYAELSMVDFAESIHKQERIKRGDRYCPAAANEKVYEECQRAGADYHRVVEALTVRQYRAYTLTLTGAAK